MTIQRTWHIAASGNDSAAGDVAERAKRTWPGVMQRIANSTVEHRIIVHDDTEISGDIRVPLIVVGSRKLVAESRVDRSGWTLTDASPAWKGHAAVLRTKDERRGAHAFLDADGRALCFMQSFHARSVAGMVEYTDRRTERGFVITSGETVPGRARRTPFRRACELAYLFGGEPVGVYRLPAIRFQDVVRVRCVRLHFVHVAIHTGWP